MVVSMCLGPATATRLPDNIVTAADFTVPYVRRTVLELLGSVFLVEVVPPSKVRT
jgi:hypothetical protein